MTLASPLALDEAGIGEDSPVVAKESGADAGSMGELHAAQFLVAGQQLDQPQPVRIGEGRKDLGSLLDIHLSILTER